MDLMKASDIASSTRSAEIKLGRAVAGEARPSRRRSAIFSQASKLGLRGLQRNAKILDTASQDASHPIKHKFVDQKKVTAAQAELAKAANRASRRRSWHDRDRGALAFRNFANTVLNLLIAAGLLWGMLIWIGAI